MFQHQSGPGEPRPSTGGGQRPEGNRPAHNARKATPGSVLSRGAFQGKENASDFLGLDEELAAGAQGSAPHELLGHDVPLEEPGEEDAQGNSWLMQGADAELIHIDDEQAQPVRHPAAREEPDAEELEDTPIVSWREPARRESPRKLMGVAAGIIVVGMLGVAGYKLFGVSASPTAIEPEPLAAEGNPLPRAIESMSTPKVDAEAAAADLERLAFAPSGEATPQAPRTDFTEPPPDPRAAFESARGDEAPVWFDPQQHGAEQAGAGYEEPQDAMLQSSADAGQTPSPALATGPEAVASEQATAPDSSGIAMSSSEPAPSDAVSPDLPLSEYLEQMRRAQSEAAGGGLDPAVDSVPSGSLLDQEPTIPVADAGGAQPSGEAAPDPLARTAESPAIEIPSGASSSQAPAVLETAVEVVAADSPASELAWQGASAPTDSAPPQGDPSGAGPQMLPSQPVDLLAGPGPLAVAQASDPLAVSELGPLPLPAGAGIENPASSPSEVDRFLESRQGRTSTLKIEDVLLAPTLDAGNLRQATSKDLSGIWDATSVPLEHVDHKTKVLTPNVGRVRVVLKTKDIFEGNLYAVGEGSMWLDTKYGRMGLAGMRIDRVEQLDVPSDAPALGAPGSQSFAGMARVRVKTPGGVFYGKVISRDDQTTTLITDDGARITILSKDVELLVDAPRVAIKEEPVAPKKP